MARKTWTAHVQGEPHEVALDWTYFRGGRTVTVDGRQVAKSTVPMRWRSRQEFDVAGAPAVLVTKPVKPVSAYFDITLEVAGERVPATSTPGTWDV